MGKNRQIRKWSVFALILALLMSFVACGETPETTVPAAGETDITAFQESCEQTDASEIDSTEAGAESTSAPAENTQPETESGETESRQPQTTEPDITYAPAETTEPMETTSVSEETVPAPVDTTAAPAEPAYQCTLNIRCDTILNHMDDLEEGLAQYVPSDGWILSRQVEFTLGESVFDVLKRVCSSCGIPLDASYSPQYNSSYVEGINNIYEFSCGSQSGWMYEVNGVFPEYGCSQYTVSDGDKIQWKYTCEGLGADIK